MDTTRIAALLRLPLIGVLAAAGPMLEIMHWLPVAYRVTLLVWGAAAVLWCAAVWGSARRTQWPVTVLDVLALLVLCACSGGGTSVLVPVFFVIPVMAAFLHGPRATAAIGALTTVGFMAAWLFYAVRDDAVDLPAVVFLYLALLVWLVVAMTAAAAALERRARAVAELLRVRDSLTGQVLRAEDRERRSLADRLHDGPLQNVLAARMDIDEARDRAGAAAHPALDAADRILRETVIGLRGTVRALSPQVLAGAGLARALEDFTAEAARRGGFAVDLRVEDVGRPPAQVLVLSAARELITNAAKHARAGTVEVLLRRVGDELELVIADNGVGFDPRSASTKIAGGHIGLASQALRIRTVGGSWRFDGGPGAGTRVTIRVPAAADGEGQPRTV